MKTKTFDNTVVYIAEDRAMSAFAISKGITIDISNCVKVYMEHRDFLETPEGKTHFDLICADIRSIITPVLTCDVLYKTKIDLGKVKNLKYYVKNP